MRYEVKSNLKPHEAIAQALTYFGPKGLGLVVKQRQMDYLLLEGGGGYVAIAVRRSPDEGDEISIELESREWDFHVQKFMGTVVSKQKFWNLLTSWFKSRRR